MNALFNQNISEIIAEAAKSPLGIFALMIIIISILAYYLKLIGRDGKIVASSSIKKDFGL